MNFLPQASGTRPRVACEIMPQGVIAARSADAAAPLAAVSKVALVEGAVVPGLKPGNIVDRVAVTAAIRRALEQVGERPNSRTSTNSRSSIALVIPDAAVRVLLLDFEALPTRLTEALPLVRFRLKKLLPFDSDDAMVTFQAMSSSKSVVRVLAVAIPRDVLSEYETVVREAGFEPGAVLPSTLAALAAVDGDSAELLVNANPLGVTAAIVRSGVLLLHRSVDLQQHSDQIAFSGTPIASGVPALPLVDVEATAGEWAAQEALPEHGRNPYADRLAAETAAQNFDGVTGLPDPGVYIPQAPPPPMHEAGRLASLPEPEPLSAEIAQAVSVAAAYFEDTLAVAPMQVLSAGPLGADKLSHILSSSGVGEGDGLRVRELVETSALLPEAVTSAAPRAWLSGVLGALRG
jgi:type IV pilus assembly protein PilM